MSGDGGFLLDTTVLSELRKGDRADPAVVAWYESADGERLYISVIVLGELRRGVELKRRREPGAGASLDRWLRRLQRDFGDRVIAIDLVAADEWGRLGVPDALPVSDGLIAASALANDLTVVTRNVQDFARAGVPVLDPWRWVGG